MPPEFLTSYLYLDLAEHLIWESTPEEGQPACLHTLYQKFAFPLSKRALTFQPGVEEPEQTVGKDKTAES